MDLPTSNQGTKYNPLYDPATDNQPIEETVQKTIINDPKEDPSGILPEDSDFLNKVMAMIESSKINLYSADTLINHAVYDGLSEEIRGKADFNAVNLLSTLRQIQALWKIEKTATFQVKNLIHQVRMTKERVESECGDVFII